MIIRHYKPRQSAKDPLTKEQNLLEITTGITKRRITNSLLASLTNL